MAFRVQRYEPEILTDLIGFEVFDNPSGTLLQDSPYCWRGD